MHPAPWTLTGTGLILLYRFKAKEVASFPLLSDRLQDRARGGMGALMFVDYHTSDAGPYQEALLVPGIFQYPNLRAFTITTIYVNRVASMLGGRDNWGIPKQRAGLKTELLADGSWRFQDADRPDLLAVTAKPWGIRFPLSTRLFPSTIVQEYIEQRYTTEIQAQGKARFARIPELIIDPSYFSGIPSLKPMAAVMIEEFKMKIGEPKVERIEE